MFQFTSVLFPVSFRYYTLLGLSTENCSSVMPNQVKAAYRKAAQVSTGVLGFRLEKAIYPPSRLGVRVELSHVITELSPKERMVMRLPFHQNLGVKEVGRAKYAYKGPLCSGANTVLKTLPASTERL